MNLALSNLGWDTGHNERVYRMMQDLGIRGLEIAPTKLFGGAPYDDLSAAAEYRRYLAETFGLAVVSMQSLWYGRTERIFGSEAERKALAGYTETAADFAAAVGCPTMVFGCPKNRVIGDKKNLPAAAAFFKEIGDSAAKRGAVIALEPNPGIYGTDFLNTTREALDFIRFVNSPGLAVNLDFGTVIANGEPMEFDAADICGFRHVHISEPNLPPPKRREEHRRLRELLERHGYGGFVSLEMAGGTIEDVVRSAAYLAEVFG